MLERLSAALGGPEIWIKRDDCTGLSTGGNKTRKLEFLMAEAAAEHADVVITQGATQSNHVRQTAAFAAKLGMACDVLLEDRTGYPETNYNKNGNVLLDDLHGARTEMRANGSDMNAELDGLADKLRAAGKKVYVIPGGGSNPTGALGYANCALELVQQLNDRNLPIDSVVHATGSAGTQAGLIAGLAALHARIPVLGIGVRAPRDVQQSNVLKLARATASKIDSRIVVDEDSVVANCDYVGEGYGVPAPATIEAIRLFAQSEGILLDPVYSGKAAAGLIDLCRRGHFRKGQRIVFLHTGGSAALFGYLEHLAPSKSSRPKSQAWN